jgi:hypothetical protein
MRTLPFALVSLLALAACEPPPVRPTADRRQNQHLARIEGNVVVQSTARGNVIVMLFDERRPPPPQGSGRPVAFAVLPRSTVFGAAPFASTFSGPFTAGFTFDQVPAGRYLLRGFIDADTCAAGVNPSICHTPDWLPWYSVTSEPNAGDVGGGAVDPSNPAVSLVVEVRSELGADGVERVLPVSHVTVSFSEQAATVQFDRPSFRVNTLGDSAVVDVNDASLPFKPLLLEPESVDDEVVRSTPFMIPPQRTTPAFIVRFADDNGDGQPDKDAFGYVTWPKVLVRKLADGVPSGLVEENDLNRDGILDESTAEQEAIEYPVAPGFENVPGADKVVLLARIDVTHDSLRGQLFEAGPDGSPTPKMAAVAVAPALPLRVFKRAADIADPKRTTLLAVPPSGRYSITLLQCSATACQSWKVPNELAPKVAEGVGLPVMTSQGFTLQVSQKR